MSLFFTRQCLFIAILLTVAHSHAVFQSRDAPPTVYMDIRLIDEATISWEGWEISGCGNPTSAKVNSLLGFLFQFKPHVEAVIADARLGLRSPHGYAAFFKTITSMRKVKNKYEALKDASPVIVSSERARIIGKHTAQPRFQCIDENDLNQANILEQCLPLGTTSGFEPRPPLIFFPGTEIIAVCPSFFQLNQYRQPQREGGSALLCPPLGGDGKFPSGNGVLLTSAFGYAIHALVLLKNRELWDGREDWNTIFDIQNAVELSARDSLLNAESYAFYAGGRFLFGILMVKRRPTNMSSSRSSGLHDFPQSERPVRWRVESLIDCSLHKLHLWSQLQKTSGLESTCL